MILQLSSVIITNVKYRYIGGIALKHEKSLRRKISLALCLVMLLTLIPLAPPASAQTVDGVAVGTYENAEYASSVTLKADRTFSFAANFGEGIETITGTWSTEHMDSGEIGVHLKVTSKHVGLPVEVMEYRPGPMSSTAKMCRKEGIPYTAYDATELTNALSGIKSKTLVVSAFNLYLFPADIVDKANFTIINFHNSLLPRHAGRNAEAWALFRQDKNTGITWHYVTNNVDGGDIIYQSELQADPALTSLILLNKQIEMGVIGYRNILLQVLTDTAPRVPQKEHLQFHLSSDIPGDGLFSLQWDFEQASAFLRALDYGPLHILGQPYIFVGGNKYFWRTYKFLPSPPGTGAIPTASVDGNDIQICYAKQTILLSGISLSEDGKRTPL